jgi:hypothetical protein
MYYVFYFLWRQQGGQLQGYSFALFWIFAIIMSVYLAGWVCHDAVPYQIPFNRDRSFQDMLVDWSVLDPNAPYKFLRSNLIYTNYIPVRISPP